MQFNETATRSGLVQEVEDLTGVGATGITGNTILFQTTTRNINQWYLKAIAWLLESSHKWQFDDSNYTSFPRAYTTMIADQNDYTLPPAVPPSGLVGGVSTFLRLIKIAVLNSAGDEVVLAHTDESEARLNEMYPTSGMPEVYILVGNSVKLFPAPSASMTTLVAGLFCYFERSVDLFTTADTTQEPTLPEPFHRILSLGASYDYALSQGGANMNNLRQEIEALKKEMQSFQVGRNRDVRIRMSPRRERYT